jgi:hypothetical protein
MRRTALVTVILLGLVIVPPRQRCSAQDGLPLGAKGIYLWQLWTANGGGRNLDAIVAKLQSVGVGWLVIKMADGDSYYNSPNHSLYNWVLPNYGTMDSVVAILHSNGIKLLAFQYVYGVPHHWGNAVSETDVANMILDVKGIDGLLIDAEIQYDTLATRVDAARAYCDSIRAHHAASFIGLTAWARIIGHSTFPWQTFLDRDNVNMPQTYWAARPTTPSNELNLMSSQFTTYTNLWKSQGDSAAAKPIMPLGQGEYFGYSNDVLEGDITAFCALSQTTYNCPGVSLWEYNQISHQYVWDEYTAAWQPSEVSNANVGSIEYGLSQNYPNPFNPTTVVSYQVSVVSEVRLRVYDVLGREVRRVVDEREPAGRYSVPFDATGLSSGVYICRLTAGKYVGCRKMVFMK